MAKKTVSTLQDGSSKNRTKVVKMVKSPNGTYSFKEEVVPNELVDDFFKKEK
ncbi:MAG TPA: DUF4295 domain-containing protein [Cryomorphaceae bacterium]|nr:DUF4295 domain-containing protein [Cryomorphaceae bacterium]